MTDEWVVVGRVTGLFGVQGWIKVLSHTRRREDIFNYPRWCLRREGEHSECELLAGRSQGKGLIARLQGFEDREFARAWIGADILVHRDALPALAPGEFYWSQLEGMSVVNTSGVDLGRVRHLFDTGANDVMVVDGDRERMIPFVRAVVLDVDLIKKIIQVDWDADF